MSATFRLANKRKISQDELRRLMAEQKAKVPKKTPKIDNPLAKYNDAGQLFCVLCNSVVRSEKVWQVHINGKQHKDNVIHAKKLKELTNNFTSTVKSHIKRGESSHTLGEKRVKSILKNSSTSCYGNNNEWSIKTEFNNEGIQKTEVGVDTKKSAKLPEKNMSSNEEVKTEASNNETSDQPIPEGFFDDPILDAKARHIEYKDPIEEEWEKFQKEIREEATASAEIIAGEQEEATTERQIDEIDEQIRIWSRVLDLELKKEETKKRMEESNEIKSSNSNNDSENETDIDEFLDWRAKKAYR